MCFLSDTVCHKMFIFYLFIAFSEKCHKLMCRVLVGLLKSRRNKIHFQLSSATTFPDIFPKKGILLNSTDQLLTPHKGIK